MSYFDTPSHRAALDRWITREPRLDHYGRAYDEEEFELTCLLVETYDREERLVNQTTLPLEEYPQLTARDATTGEYQLECLVLKFRDGSEMIVSRNEP